MSASATTAPVPSAAAAAAATATVPAPMPPSRTIRLADSHLVFPIWRAIRELQHEQRPTNLDTIVQHLQQRHRHQHPQLLQLAAVVAQLARMTEDGLLVQLEPEQEDGEDGEEEAEEADSQKAHLYRLPLADDSAQVRTDDSIAEPEPALDWTGIRPLPSCCLPADRDAYCYECHQAGAVLSCAECPRVFHATCIRPAARLDVPLLRLREPVPEAVEKTWARAFDFPYARAKAWVNGAPTAAAAAARDDPQAARLCVRCRLLKRNAVHLRPLTSVASLHRLLGYSFGAVSSWIAADTFSTQEARSVHIPEPYIALLQPVLMQRPRTAAAIHAAIQRREYRSIAEYRADVMDVVHCIGVLRGTGCAEYEAAAYLQLDVHLDCEEMTRCQDCFRASSEQKSDPDWFVRPCVVPHQLVYAKVPGFSHWPAKVIRQVRKPDAPGVVAFDVRFFGADHSRSTVPERYVIAEGRPINNIKRTVGLKKALAEMAEHKRLLAVGVPDRRDSDSDAKSTARETAVNSQSSAKRPRGRPKSVNAKAAPPAAWAAKPTPKASAAATLKPKAGSVVAAASHKKKQPPPPPPPPPSQPPSQPQSPIMLAKRSSGIGVRRRRRTTTEDRDDDDEVFAPQPKRARRSRRTTSQFTCCSSDGDAKVQPDEVQPKRAARRSHRSASQLTVRSADEAKTEAAKSPADEQPQMLRRSQRIASHFTGCSDDEAVVVAAAAKSADQSTISTTSNSNNNNNNHHVVGDESDAAAAADRVHLVNSSLSDVPMDVEDEELLVIVVDRNGGKAERAAAEAIADEVEVVPVDEDEDEEDGDDDDGEEEEEEEEEEDDDDEEEEGDDAEENDRTADKLNFVDDSYADSSPPQLDAEEPQNDTQFMIARLRRRMDNCPPHFVSVAVDALREQIEINEAIKAHHATQIAIVKRLHWCTVCLKKAIYYCCWRVSYCSSKCQLDNWKDHTHSCKRTQDDRKAAAAQAAAALAAPQTTDATT